MLTAAALFLFARSETRCPHDRPRSRAGTSLHRVCARRARREKSAGRSLEAAGRRQRASSWRLRGRSTITANYKVIGPIAEAAIVAVVADLILTG
jgi:hypothetical protein